MREIPFYNLLITTSYVMPWGQLHKSFCKLCPVLQIFSNPSFTELPFIIPDHWLQTLPKSEMIAGRKPSWIL